MTTNTNNGGIFRPPGEGETTLLFGDSYTVKAAGEETDGTLSVIEATLAPHSSGTPLHINTREDENYYIVEGTLTFQLGESAVEAPAGTFVHIPRDAVHTHWNATAAPVKMLGVPSPAGFERFFAELAGLMAQTPSGPSDVGRIAALYEKYGLQVVGPPPGQENLSAAQAGEA
jgi:quercetin dioxygenase-like cupin family protein